MDSLATTPSASNENYDANFAQTSDQAIYCPKCDYDLRHSRDRCPECGTPFDREALLLSRIPWVHRRTGGVIRCWWQTFLRTSRFSKDLAAEIGREVNWQSASRYRWTHIGLAALLVLIFTACHWRVFFNEQYGDDFALWLAIQKNPSLNDSYSMNGGLDAGSLPAFVLIGGWGIVAISSLGVACAGACLTWWVRLLAWTLGGRERGPRAASLILYLSGWWMIGIVLGMSGILLNELVIKHVPEDVGSWLKITEEFIFGIPLVFVYAKIVLSFARLTKCGWRRLAVFMVIGPVGGAMLVAGAIYAVAYTLGFLTLVIGSVFKA